MRRSNCEIKTECKQSTKETAKTPEGVQEKLLVMMWM
jgi:hypothetical protein